MEERNSQGHSHCSPCHVFQKEHGIHINWLTSSTKIATLHLYHIFIYTARLHLYRNDSECKDEIYFNSPTQKKISALSRRFKYQKIYNWNFSMSYTILTMQTLRNTTIPNWKKPAKILQHLQKKKKKAWSTQLICSTKKPSSALEMWLKLHLTVRFLPHSHIPLTNEMNCMLPVATITGAWSCCLRPSETFCFRSIPTRQTHRRKQK